MQCALAEVDIADAIVCLDQAVGMIDGLGNPETFFAVSEPFGEGARISETPGQQVTRQHRGQRRETETLLEQCPFEGHQVLPQEVYGLRIVSQRIACPA